MSLGVQNCMLLPEAVAHISIHTTNGVMIMASLSWQLIQPAVEMLSQGRFCIKIAGSQVGVLLRDFVLQTQ